MERNTLSKYATLSAESVGRARVEKECDIRTVFQRDRDRILHSKSFRRLKDKTQVFLSPEGDHYRTRMTHTLEVSQNARTIAKALRLNEDLVEAIALGHDLGHTPFGHAGERSLNAICPMGFHHNEQSVRIVEVLEKDGRGLNLTWEVRDGILNHQTSRMPKTAEGKVVRLSDKLAYINHDMDDAIRAGVLREADIPHNLRLKLGGTTRERLNTLIHDIVTTSLSRGQICMSEEIEDAMRGLRTFLFEHVYTNPVAKGEEGKAVEMVAKLYEYYIAHPDEMSQTYLNLLNKGEQTEIVVCDYISGMTDQYAVHKFESLFIPSSWKKY
ncbi:MAG: deoxyguanosinetriphosphate triphosphohydrolase [Eubacterium sp.]|nr:deoxyguanosinetriphosphate triphosphohydrolase [Eubacterium sp.]